MNDPADIRLITVQTRRQKYHPRRDLRRVRVYESGELRVSNKILKAAGIEVGDLVFVTAPREQTLVISVVERDGKPVRPPVRNTQSDGHAERT